ncbi:kita-kyushu lung cancer antigen 1 [Cavia porcellus]|uniref:kita-kyushu lung cancer antigen 1 n=1 Tax=Cavia porcellus TaxID=10141 RepID=UPI000350E12C|nr:kita-kyushu lung cancer antigen 1 [Cavia porcellus]
MIFSLFLVSGVVIAFVISFWKNHFQTKDDTDETPSNSSSPDPIRTFPWSSRSSSPESSSSTQSLSSSTDSVSVDSVSPDIFNNFPHSVAIQNRILVNLRIVKYKLAELENYLIIKGFRSSLIIERSIEEVARCNANTGNH